MASDGASNNERLLAAAREDNEEILLEVFEEGNFDINFKDGQATGVVNVDAYNLNTYYSTTRHLALHYAVSHGSTTALEHLLEYDGCDVDPINRLEGATPLHLALKLEDPELRLHIANSLLEAGADTTIKDKEGDTALDLLQPGDDELRKLIRKSQASSSVSKGDIANDDDDEGSEGSGSESE
ncbi:ankyrin [Sanghuangporus baumii]|uniref:Ankyrin n=1 Tax=Sanghuangporus baumii TaxID=108892 RepID=A0A9Q5NAY3_SANBA|nr:ankyrin [Sanghuangporus baumii]